MLPLRYARGWRIAGIVLLALVFIATLLPSVWLWPRSDKLVFWFIDADKWLHAATFLFLAIWFAGQYRRRSYWRIGLGLIAFGTLIEVCQRMLSYRSAEWFDLTADIAGIVVGLSMALTGLGGWSVRFEHWLTKRRAGAAVD